MSKKQDKCENGKHCPKFQAIPECDKRHSKIDLALFGEDGRGGIVKDVQEIKTATSIFRTVILPVLLSLTSAGVVAYLLTR